MFHQNCRNSMTYQAQKNFHTISDFTKCCWLVMLVVGLIDIQHMQAVIKGFFFPQKNCYYFSDLEIQWPELTIPPTWQSQNIELPIAIWNLRETSWKISSTCTYDSTICSPSCLIVSLHLHHVHASVTCSLNPVQRPDLSPYFLSFLNIVTLAGLMSSCL